MLIEVWGEKNSLVHIKGRRAVKRWSRGRDGWPHDPFMASCASLWLSDSLKVKVTCSQVWMKKETSTNVMNDLLDFDSKGK